MKPIDAGKLRVVGIDMGGTQIRAALFDGHGRILTRTAHPTEASSGAERVLKNLEIVFNAVLPDNEQVSIAGMCLPGVFNSQSGRVSRMFGFPYWTNTLIGEILEKRLGLPVVLGNDANLAALGENRFGAGRNYTSLLYLTISSGVGGGVIEKGRIVGGSKGIAGELGHVSVNLNGPQCPCGNFGCLTMYTCGPAIAHYARNELKDNRDSLLWSLCEGDLQKVNPEIVGEAARKGDKFSCQLLKRTGQYLGAGVVTFLHSYNPGIVIIGGGVSQLGPLLLDATREWVAKYAMEAYRDTPIVITELGDDVGLYGTAALAIENLI